jgi:sigma-B regulation protein RsbU (phosphoserine phosphatase)
VKVLIAEDDAVTRRILESHLQKWGHEVTAATNGAEAWQHFQADEFPLVLSDWMMPELDGVELVRRVRSCQRPGYVYTILLTARTEKEDLMAGMAAGADDFLTKPIDVDVLRVRVREAERILRLERALLERNRTLAAQKAEMERDLLMAREIQEALLPQSYPCFPCSASPDDSALRFCHRYCPTGAVGGDFFSVLALSDTQAGVFIADVVGHGVRSALITAMVRAFIEEFRPVAAQPGRFMSEFNRELLEILAPLDVPMFLTALYLVVDTETGQVRYVNAGHPAPLHVCRAAGTVTPLPPPAGKPGPPLGVRPEIAYLSGEAVLAANDLLFLFTDGLFEVPGGDGQSYGVDRLLAAVQSRLHLPTPDLFDAVLADASHFAPDGRFQDDVCLLGVERM